MRFDDPQYVRDFLASGRLPAIHAGITAAIRDNVRARQHARAVDFGACTGLLSVAIRQAGVERVLAIESNWTTASRGVDYPGIDWHLARVEPNRAQSLRKRLAHFSPSLAVLRRVLPEISGESLERADWLADLLADVGIISVILEGRLASARSVHPLKSIAEEVAIFESRGQFREIERRSAVSILERRGRGSEGVF